MKKSLFSHIYRGASATLFGVFVLTFLTKMTLGIKELAIAGRYGRSDEADAFLIAFLVPSFVAMLLGNAMSIAAIPVYLRYKSEEGGAAARSFVMSMNGLLLAACAVLAFLIWIAGPFYLPAIASAFSSAKSALSYKLLEILIPVVCFSGIAAFWSAVLNAEERFAVVLLVPMITPFTIIACLLLLPFQRISVVAYGTLLGICGELLVLGFALRRNGFVLWPRWEGWSAPVRSFIRQFMPAAAGGILMGSTQLVDQAMAAMLPAGGVAALSYGNKLIGFLLAILATLLGTLLMPYFSKKTAGIDPRAGRNELGQLLLVIIPSGLLLSLAVSAFAIPSVRIIFYRGAFTHADVGVVAGVQSWLAWQIPFYLGSVVLVRFVAALQKNWIIPYVTACNLVLNITLNFILMKRMGVEGIALSTSLVHLFSFLFLALFVYFSGNSRS